MITLQARAKELEAERTALKEALAAASADASTSGGGDGEGDGVRIAELEESVQVGVETHELGLRAPYLRHMGNLESVYRLNRGKWGANPAFFAGEGARGGATARRAVEAGQGCGGGE